MIINNFKKASMEPYISSNIKTGTTLAAQSHLATKSHQRYLHKLESIYSKKDEKKFFLTDFFHQIISKIKDFFRSTRIYGFTKEHYLTLLAQENLTTHGNERGSSNYHQKNLFCKLMEKTEKYVKTNHPNRIEKHRKELEQMNTLDGNHFRSFFPGAEARMAKDLLMRFQQLNYNESMWIDLSSLKGEHSMKGRILKTNDNKYILQMANTGAGVDHHPDLHPRKDEIAFYQTVVEWGPLKEDIFTYDFFKDIITATLINPKKIDKSLEPKGEGANGEDIQAIDAVYDVLKKRLPKESLKEIPFQRNSPYWSPLQEGPSCTPQSIWALTRVALRFEDYYNLKISAVLKSLKSMYKRICSGKDQSNYSYLKAYEHAMRLIIHFEFHNKKVPILDNIAADLSKRLKEREYSKKIKIINESPLKVDQYTTQLTLREGNLIPVAGALKAKVEYETHNQHVITIERNEKGKPTGLTTLAYLLYESILADNDIEIEKSLNNFTQFILNKQGPDEFIINQPKILENLVILFSNLSNNLQVADGTIASRPKQIAIHNIAQTLFSIYFANTGEIDLDIYKRLQEQQAECMAFSDSLGGKARSSVYFQDNIWYKGNLDKAVRPHTFLPKWLGYADRRELYLPNFKNSRPKILNPEGWELKEGRLPIQAFDFVNQGNKMATSFKKINFKMDFHEIEVLKKGNQYESPTISGNLYLFYCLLAQGGDHKSIVENLETLLSKIKDTEITREEIPYICEVASLLVSYGKSGKETVDRSLESLLIRQITAQLGHAILARAKIKQEDLVRIEPAGNNLEKEKELLSVINTRLSAANEEVQYFKGLNPAQILVKISNIDQNYYKYRPIFRKVLEMEVQAEIDVLNKLASLKEIEEWISKRKNQKAWLRALAGGIQLPDGEKIESKAKKEIIEQAFRNQNLSYANYSQIPVALNLLE